MIVISDRVRSVPHAIYFWPDRFVKIFESDTNTVLTLRLPGRNRSTDILVHREDRGKKKVTDFILRLNSLNQKGFKLTNKIVKFSHGL